VPKVDIPESCPGPAPLESDLESAAGYLLENPSIRRYHPSSMVGENASGADNQQERPASDDEFVDFVRRELISDGANRLGELESSEAIRQPPRNDQRGEDMVLAAWRHAGT